MAKKGPHLPNLQPFIASGINPQTGLPNRFGSSPALLKENIKRLLKIQDRQTALNRYTWYNLPHELSGNLIERILYYRGKAALFYMEANSTFYFLPYALNGTIDVYGEYLGITPVPFAGGTTKDGNGDVDPWITGLKKIPHDEWKDMLEITRDEILNGCVLLWDYSKGVSQDITPRNELQDPILDIMSEMVPFMRTSLINGTGTHGMKVQDESERSNVQAANQTLVDAALTGNKWLPITGTIDFQELAGGSQISSQEYMMAYQALNNMRMNAYGLTNGGAYQKQGTILQSESDMNNANTELILQDGLYQRQMFCTLVNNLFGLQIWCEVSDAANIQEVMNENEEDQIDPDDGQGVESDV